MNGFTPSPALVQTRDHARERETDITIPIPERALWKQLADEIDAFTGASLTDPALSDDPADYLFSD